MAKVWRAGMRDRFALELVLPCIDQTSGSLRRDRIHIQVVDRAKSVARNFDVKLGTLRALRDPQEVYEVRMDGNKCIRDWRIVPRGSAERESILRLWKSDECQEQARACREAWGI